MSSFIRQTLLEHSLAGGAGMEKTRWWLADESTPAWGPEEELVPSLGVQPSPAGRASAFGPRVGFGLARRGPRGWS